ncbi:hypothetical protein LZ32DRAFT_427251 [Colletotrichum eremochloae]|nr:hypothetical protein LZ32DRAFT_427251 [Colletotrichum eremochloae]
MFDSSHWAVACFAPYVCDECGAERDSGVGLMMFLQSEIHEPVRGDCTAARKHQSAVAFYCCSCCPLAPLMQYIFIFFPPLQFPFPSTGLWGHEMKHVLSFLCTVAFPGSSRAGCMSEENVRAIFVMASQPQDSFHSIKSGKEKKKKKRLGWEKKREEKKTKTIK